MNKVYHMIVSNDLYIKYITVTAPDLNAASKLAKEEFCRAFKSFGNIKVRLDARYLENCIDEIVNILYEGDNYYKL